MSCCGTSLPPNADMMAWYSVSGTSSSNAANSRQNCRQIIDLRECNRLMRQTPHKVNRLLTCGRAAWQPTMHIIISP